MSQHSNLRRFGVEFVGSVPWGTHLCQFYESKQDLIDILVPYFAEGLRSNEFCMWVTSKPLEVEEAKAALKKAVPDLEEYFRKGQIEIIPYKDWYLLGGKFDADRVLQGWVKKETDAVKRGFAGLRLTGNTFWIERNLWKSFVDYEEAVNAVIDKHKMLALCTYCLKSTNGTDVFDVVRNHMGTLLKRGEKWILVEDAGERKREEQELQRAKTTWENTFDSVPDLIAVLDKHHKIMQVNRAMAKQLGVTPQECTGLTCFKCVHATDAPPDFCPHAKSMRDGKEHIAEVHEPRLGGDFLVSTTPLRDEKGRLIGSVHVARNITDRKKSEDSLRESEQRWSTTLSSIGDAVIATDVNGNVTFMNSIAEKLTGWTLKEAKQKPIEKIFKIVNEYTRKESENPVARVLNEGVIVGLANHTVLIRKDGVEIPIDDSGAPIKGKGDKITGVVLVFRDITDRKKAEETILKAKERSEFDRKRLETILEATPSAVVIIEAADGKFSFVNKRAMQLYGFDTLGLDLQENVAKVKARRADGSAYPIEEMPVSRSLRLGIEVHNEEMIIENAKGKAFPIMASAAPLRDMQGNITAAIVVWEDISEHKKAEKTLRDSEVKFRTVANYLYDWEYWLAPDGSLAYVSPSCEKITGYKASEFTKKPSLINDIVHPADTHLFDSHFKLSKDDKAHEIDFRIVAKNGETRWLSHACRPVFDDKGNWIGRRVSNRDITERKKAEEALKQSEQQYNSLFSNMASGFAYCKMLFDEQGRPDDFIYLQINDMFEKITGIKRELVIGRKVTEAIPGIKEATPELFTTYGRVAQTRNSEKFEINFTPLHMWLSVSVYSPERGYFAAVFENITERKRSEEALKDSEERLNRSQEIAHLGSWELDLTNDKLTWTDEVYRIFGLKPQEFDATYEAFLEAIHPDDRAAVDAAYSNSVKEGKPGYEIEHRVVRKLTGEIRTVHEKCQHVRDGSGKIVRSMGMVHDITDLKKAEDNLRYSNEQLSLISSINSQLLSTTKPQVLIQDLCTGVMNFLNCDVFFNFLVDEEKEKLHLNAYAGVTPEVAKSIEWLSFGEAVCGCAAQEGKCIVCENIPDVADVRTTLVRSFGVKAYAAHPLFSQGKVIGTLSFGSKKKAWFSEDELSLMKTVAAQVSVAMERKKAEDALLKANAQTEIDRKRLETILETSPTAVVILEAPNGKISYVNKRAMELYGFDTVGLDLEENVAKVKPKRPDGTPYPVQDVPASRALIGQEVHNEEMILEQPSGKSYPILVSAAPIFDAHGTVTAAVAIFEEITERKKTEEALRKSEALSVASRYARSLIEASLDPLVTISTTGKITDVNKATELATGCSRQQLIGSDFSDYFTEPQKANEGYREVFNKGFVKDYPLAIRHKNGKITDVLYNATVYRNETGQIQGVFAAARDVTDRKKAEAAVQTERKRLYDVLETVPAMVCLITPDYHIVFANRSFREKFGESHGRHCYEYCFEQSEPCKFCESMVPFKTGQPHHWEVKSLDGTVIEAHDYPFTDVDGSPLILEMDIDITERKKAEERLRAVSQYTRSLIEASLDPLVTISADGKITDVNQATEEVTGYTREQLIGSDFSDYFTEPEKARLGYRQVFSEGFVQDYPLAIRHKSGRITDVLYNATVYRNEQGQIQGVFAAARDVTERKIAEEKLRAASLYARTLLEASLDPLVTISAEGKITDVNQATEYATGLSREQLIGSDFSNYFTEPEQARKGYQQVFTDGLVKDYPLAIRHVSGKIIDVLYNATLYTNEAGEVQGVFAAARDITERKKAEEQLRTASLYSRTLLESSLDPLVTISADGKITDVNKATEDVTGYSREQLIGSDFSDYFTEPERARAGYKQVFTDFIVKDYPLAIRHRSGKITDVIYNATVFRNAQGEIQGVFAAARDITERKKMENELRETLEKLRQSNAELEQFAYVASHDLQEPLRMVASYVQLIQKRYQGKLDSNADEFIGYAVDGANRMQRLIEDLLVYSRIGRLGKPFEKIDLESTLEITLKNLQTSINENNATVTHDKLPTITADEGQLVQLFQNLIGNAIKFHGKDSPKVHISSKDMGAAYQFAIADNGIGIDPQYLDRLFRIFQRLHTREEYPGSGIGLAVCKKIVERHGGRIWIESEVGKGSTIYFTLSKKEHEVKSRTQ